MDLATYGLTTCRTCGGEFRRMTTTQVYCSLPCRERWKYLEKKRKRPVTTADPRECVACGDWFLPRSHRQVCCDMECRIAFAHAIAVKIRTCEWCGRESFGGRAKSHCNGRCRARSRLVARNLSNEGLVYFVQGVNGGPVKIGRTKDPEKRMWLLQNGNPERLVYRALVAGGVRLEFELHQRFERHRLVGEWFEPAPELVATMAGYAEPQIRLVADAA